MMQEDNIVLERSEALTIPAQTIPLPIPLSIAKKRSIIDQIKDKMGDQDFNQKVTVSITVILEMYRVLVSSFLVLFVPQKCDDHVCSLSENMVLENHLYSAGLVFNFITMASFLAMYTLEVKRENRLITYLEVNKSVPSDNSSVGIILEKLPIEKRNNIWQLDKYYMYSGLTSIVIFIINTILSGFVVYNYYLDSQTTSTYITNILFMVTKLADVYANVNTEKNVFISAYMKGKIQYNDVDPDKMVLLLSNVENVDDVNLNKEELVPGISPPLKDDLDKKVNLEVDKIDLDVEEGEGGEEGEEGGEGGEEGVVNLEEDSKIIVTIHDISSNPSSSNNLQSLDNTV